jgi:putative ABC transport system substrate-binding protein
MTLLTITRRQFAGALGNAALWPIAADDAMAEAAVRRIGLLGSLSSTDPEAQARNDALQQGLKDLGWVEGVNLQFEFRWVGGEGDELRVMARELVALKPDLIVSHATPATAALLKETHTVPILFIPATDPVASGFVSSLAHPGGNATGFLTFEISMGGKWLQTLKEIAPQITRAAMLFNPDTAPYWASYVHVIEDAAHSLKVATIATPVREEADLDRVISAFAAEPNGGLIVLPDTFNSGHRDEIVALAASHRLPAIYPFRYFAASGGLISDGPVMIEEYRRAARYIDLILRGADPGELPVQSPPKYEMVINLKTAQDLGLAVSPVLLIRADEVIFQ